MVAAAKTSLILISDNERGVIFARGAEIGLKDLQLLVELANEGWTARVAQGSVRPSTSIDAQDAARYRWLRNGNGYVPEEEGVTGWEDLDQLCDEGLAESEAQGGGDPCAT